MAIQNDETLITKGDLKELYQNKILPYLGGNMMMATNVSDYRSADEKCIGIWTDGKPLYQKTYIGNTPSSSGGVLCSISSLDTLVWAGGVVKYSNGNTIIVPQTSTEIFRSGTTNNILFAGPTGWFNCPCYITFQYTKTTDTATSALTTPGCYDLNRPDLWPVDKEIFFGNGLYGYRKTGTNITVPKQNRADIILITTGNANTKIYNSGGTLENANWKYAIPSSHTAGNGDQFIWFNKNSGSWTNNSIMFYISNNSATTALNYTSYDVWVTYTK